MVLDTFSRRVVGWPIDSSQTSALVTNALGMAISNRDPQAGGDSGMEALRVLKRGLSDVVYAALRTDLILAVETTAA